MKSLPAILIALSLGGCAIVPPPSAELVIAKVDYSFEASYNVAAKAYLAAPTNLDPTLKANAKGLLLSMLDCRATPCTGYVQAARNAVLIGDSTTLAQEVSEITAIAQQVQQLVKGQ